jgi:hypothetical protein
MTLGVEVKVKLHRELDGKKTFSAFTFLAMSRERNWNLINQKDA